jgi:poly(hydroxyalkanoate) depolymerase family esterase
VAPSAFRPQPTRPQYKSPEAPAPGRFLTENFSNHAGTLSYKLYVPAAYHGQSLPLVVMLHGCTQNPDDFAAGTRMNQLAETTPCLVAYPAQSQSANMSRCWNWFKASDQQRDQGEPAVIAGITREIAGAYAVDMDRIYVAGLSSGGAMAAIMGATYPDLFAAMGIHSAPDYTNAHDLPSAFAAMHGGGAMSGFPQGEVNQKTKPSKQFVPNIMFHGDQDYTVRPGSSDQVSEYWNSTPRPGHGRLAADAGLDVSQQRGQVPGGHAYTQSVYRDPAGKAVAEHWLIHGAGHAWSGGSVSGTYTDARGPDATGEMMRFFREHRLSDGAKTGR